MEETLGQASGGERQMEGWWGLIYLLQSKDDGMDSFKGVG